MLELFTSVMGHHDGRHSTFMGGQVVQAFDVPQSLIIDSTTGILNYCGICKPISE